MQIDDVIHMAGYRVTPQRRDFLQILDEEDSLKIDLLKDRFMKRSHANLATFYRMLADFRACGYVHSIDENEGEIVFLCGEVRKNKTPSRSFEVLHCHSCGNIQDIHILGRDGTLSSKKEAHLEKCKACS